MRLSIARARGRFRERPPRMARLRTQHHPGRALPGEPWTPDLDGLAGVRCRAAGARREHATAFGDAGYFWRWGEATFENWQSEFLQLFTFVVLTTFLVHRSSHESPDTDYDTEASLRRIEAKIDALEKRKVDK